MDLPTNILGAYQVKKLVEQRARAILVIGSDSFMRRDFAKVDCYNFSAVSNLNHILNKHLKVKNTYDLFVNHDPTELALPRMGYVSLAVLGAAFEAKKLGGAAPLAKWIEQHKVKVGTWDTMKKRENAEIAAEKKALKKRKSQRRDQAHGLRVDRLEKRAADQGAASEEGASA